MIESGFDIEIRERADDRALLHLMVTDVEAAETVVRFLHDTFNCQMNFTIIRFLENFALLLFDKARTQ